MSRCLCLPQTPFGAVWLFSFVMCWMLTKLSNQYYVATYLIEQISQFWWICEVPSLWWINIRKDCQPGNVCVSVRVCANSLCWAQRGQENTWREKQKLIYDHNEQKLEKLTREQWVWYVHTENFGLDFCAKKKKIWTSKEKVCFSTAVVS